MYGVLAACCVLIRECAYCPVKKRWTIGMIPGYTVKTVTRDFQVQWLDPIYDRCISSVCQLCSFLQSGTIWSTFRNHPFLYVLPSNKNHLDTFPSSIVQRPKQSKVSKVSKVSRKIETEVQNFQSSDCKRENISKWIKRKH